MDAQEIQAFLRQHWELFQMGIGQHNQNVMLEEK